MSARLLEGEPIANRIKEQVKADVAALSGKGVTPKLVAILVGDNPGAKFYAGAQEKACASVGIAYALKEMPADTIQAQLEAAIAALNADASVHGILLLMPVPKGLDGQTAQNLIAQKKDVDGVSAANIGMIVFGRPRLAPCTAMSVIEMVKASGVDPYGAEVVVVGSSEIVGKPAALLLVDKYITQDAAGQTDKIAGATVTICHIGTSQRGDLRAHTRRADLLVVAVGKAGLISGDQIKPGAVVIDVGINRVEGKIVGDVDFESAKEVAGAITPVPGGVGVVTTAMLLRNTVEAAKWQLESSERAA
jgi:methylenetetrahydrofolate dehydrogenase (NADP+)/methenyltetrahydrofolate cyclohydrolase